MIMIGTAAYTSWVLLDHGITGPWAYGILTRGIVGSEKEGQPIRRGAIVGRVRGKVKSVAQTPRRAEDAFGVLDASMDPRRRRNDPSVAYDA